MSFLKAMQYGQVIENPATYKNLQNSINLLVALLSIGGQVLHSYGFTVNLSEAHAVTIATALAVSFCALNALFTVITSDDMGIKIRAAQPSPSQVMAEQLPRLIKALELMLAQPPAFPAPVTEVKVAVQTAPDVAAQKAQDPAAAAATGGGAA